MSSRGAMLKCGHELARRQGAQLLLVEHRNAPPFLRLVDPVQVEVVRQAPAVDRRAERGPPPRRASAPAGRRRSRPAIPGRRGSFEPADPAFLRRVALRQWRRPPRFRHSRRAAPRLASLSSGMSSRRIADHALEIRADRADVLAAAAAGDRAGAAQDRLPQVEGILRAQHGLLLRRFGVQHPVHEVGQMVEAVGRPELVAARPVAGPSGRPRRPGRCAGSGRIPAPCTAPFPSGLSHATGAEHSTPASMTRGPYSGVSSCRFRPRVPRPASTAQWSSDRSGFIGSSGSPR